MNQPTGDAAIRATDNDAALARLSAVQKGYLVDPYIRHFVPRAQSQPPRPPLINIGTYVRATAIDDLVAQWLANCEEQGVKSQIVSMGAGSDTRFWRIMTGAHRGLSKYVEVDFPEITTKKAMSIKKSKELCAALGKPEDITLGSGGTALHSPIYHLLPANLRQPPSEALGPLLQPILSPSLPTLLLFECVLVYMSPEASGALLQWFTDNFSSEAALGCVVYEMFSLDGPFGKVMVNNLMARNVTLPGAAPYPTVASLPNRFLAHGWELSKATTLRDIRRFCIDPSELERIAALEMLDEIEELELVLAHYAVTWGVKLPSSRSDVQKATWDRWALARKEEN